MNYIIISLKHGDPKSPLFWKANCSGYTNLPFNAGIYTKEEIDGDPFYFNDGLNALAIPLTNEAMDKLGFKCSYDGEATRQFLNKR